MCDRERLSATIGDIYATCLDPSRWMDVIGKAARFVGGSAASLYSQDPCSRTGSHSVSYGIEPRYQQLYLDKYAQLDPAANGQIVARVEEPVAMADLMPYDEFVATRFYREWARPQGLVDFVASVLDKTMTSAAVFRVFRHERDGAVDDEMRQRMALVIPHLRRAMLIGNAIELKRAEAATFADALDGLGAGVFLVDADGGLVHANAAGHAILAADDFLRAIGGRLVARDALVNQSLRDILAAADDDDGEIGVNATSLPLTARDGERHVAHVLPLTRGARRSHGIAYAPAAALLVRKAALESPSAPDVIAKAYHLTPTELRVLMAIVEVGGVPEVAVALGIAETTVKTHLSRVFQKTGATRQADLVKLAAGFANPAGR